MTIRIKYIALLFVALAVGACESFIDLKPTDTLTEDNALLTLDDVQQALIGCYSGLTSSSYYGGAYIVTADRMSDDLRRSTENLGEGVQMYNFTFNAATGEPATLWAAPYIIINRANVVLGRVDDEDIEGTTSAKNAIKGQALFIRALCHFDLVRYFAERYDFTTDASHLGVPVMTVSEIAEPARNTVAEVYQQIISDLEQAATLMTTQIIGPYKGTPLAAKALLARVYLYMQDWANAKDYATQVINSNNYALATGDNYRNIWTTSELNGEVIFKLVMLQDNAAIGQNYWSQTNDIVSFNPTQDIIDVFDQSNDVRFSSFIGIRDGDPDNVVTKYRGATLGLPLDQVPSLDGLADIKILRLSEMYLIRAEANYESQDITSARSDLNTIRVARITNFNPSVDGNESGAALLTAIRTERRRELAFEGHRWQDLKRWGLAVERGDDCSATNCTLEADNYRFTLPIPQSERLANRNIEQNDGYDSN